MPTSNSSYPKKTAYFLFLAIPLVATALSSELFLRRHGDGDEQRSYKARYSELFLRKVDARVVILGSSISTHGLMPSKLNIGQPIFNFSFNGATSSFNRAFYQSFLKKYYLKPQYIIYAVSPGAFQKYWRKIEDDEKYLPTFHRQKLSIAAAVEDIKILNVQTIGLELTKAFVRENSVVRPVGMDMRTYDAGFVAFNLPKKFELKKHTPLAFDAAEIASTHQLFSEIIKDGTRIILVMMPYPYEQFRADDLNRYEKIVKNLSEEYGAHVLRADDFAPDFSKNYGYFNDEAHLNSAGALSFSTQLSEPLRKAVTK